MTIKSVFIFFLISLLGTSLIAQDPLIQIEIALEKKQFKKFNQLIDSLQDIETYQKNGRFLFLAGKGFWYQYLDVDSTKIWMQYGYKSKSFEFLKSAAVRKNYPYSTWARNWLDSLHFPLLKQQVAIYEVQNKLAESIELLQSYLFFKPTDSIYNKKLVQLYFKNGAYDSCIKRGKKYLTPKTYQNLIIYIYKKQQQYDKLNNWCDSVLKTNLQDSLAFHTKLDIVLRKKSFVFQNTFSDSLRKHLPLHTTLNMYETLMANAMEKDSLRWVAIWYKKVDSIATKSQLLSTQIPKIMGMTFIMTSKKILNEVDKMPYATYLVSGRVLEKKAKNEIRKGIEMLESYLNQNPSSELQLYLKQIERNL